MAINIFKQQVDSIIQSKHLLQHPFYIAWTEGKLTREQLRHYAEQYFYNVLAEPTYLSAVHFNTPHFHNEENCGDISVRQEVLKNLIDEEHGEKNHPALWKAFAFALGANDASLAKADALPETENLVSTFRDICINESFYAGLAALHAFESQVPDIAAVKIDGLAKFYDMKNPEDYEFFSVHQTADIFHSQAEWAIIERFADTPEKQAEVLAATRRACDALWKFLDGIHENYCANLICEEKAVVTLH
ncbi:4-aminobenzoate synthase [Nitrosomonas eutropha]|uniref:Pyrroloquinoline-quinone synthase n=2 Tax=Nitrosomonas eutropha TaxID=916 RepID=A0ABX5MAM6_9PROT|nr:CADD family putative folate metabolism protein [Nitrosomonas eutropha]ABI59797.1 TENA/THI-4 domain protein [Nitrosomonas eutropha C91]PXV83613.1 pyrroloquinoline-quinone synthase [Nitrosomonas eutropha]SCX00085.1 pyrroloquinoline-quinone synthase [Nitrosomonas eutropha]SEI58034.1 pyrroloquinoline-quinone synthase [Nitrosomonas eutropha]SEI58225.1 pyrroloquinoline-quinone synthase [Nitrosomonas eutropha]